MGENGDAKLTRAEIENCIEKLLELAYEELKKRPKYAGYPTCDLIACFLDTKVVFGENFQNIFNKVVSDYKDNWRGFEEKIIEPKLDAILNILCQLNDLKGTTQLTDFLMKSNFDLFSNNAAICNTSIASALYTIHTYANSNKNWMKGGDKENKLEKCVKLLTNTRIEKRGWQYSVITGKEDYTHTLSTWLSLVALDNIPNGEEVTDLTDEIKEQVRDWLKSKVEDCSWCFRPDEMFNDDYGDNSPNPVATAHAILALYHTGVDINDEIIRCSIKFIKDNMNYDKKYDNDIIPEARTQQGFQGTQHCLQALLIFDVPSEDETVQSLTKRTVKTVDTLYSKKRKSAIDKYSYYTTLVPLLWYLFPSAKPAIKPVLKPPLFDYTKEFKNKFESFVSEANSIILIGEIDGVYARLVPTHAHVRFIYRDDEQEDTVVELFESRGWKCDCIDKNCGLETINCVIVDTRTALLSSNPFERRKRYGFVKCLEGDEVPDLIKQLEEITDIKMPISGGDIKQEILDKLSEFPKHRDIIKQELEKMAPKEQDGILQYFKHNPEYAEAMPATLGFDSREDAEIKLADHGIISRVFTNGELRGLIKNEIKDKNFVLDESSAYLLANSIKTDTIESLLAPPVEDLYAPIDVHAILGDITLPSSTKQRLQKIGDKGGDPAEIKSERYSLTENEKIAIAFANIRKDNKYGMITNTWEVAKVCMELGINVYSLVKFLDKDEETYKMFRIPIDLLKGV
jgi:hypothetical protein